jgi:hypothetical protein
MKRNTVILILFISVVILLVHHFYIHGRFLDVTDLYSHEVLETLFIGIIIGLYLKKSLK